MGSFSSRRRRGASSSEYAILLALLAILLLLSTTDFGQAVARLFNVAGNAVAGNSVMEGDALPAPPGAQNLNVTTGYETPVVVTLTNGATGGEATAASAVSNPADGSLSAVTGSSGDFTITYTPEAGFPAGSTPGTDSFQFQLSNSGGSSNATVAITVEPPPTWTPGTPPAAENGVAYDWTMNAATPASGLTITGYSASGLPGWLSLNSSTGALTGTPTGTGTVSGVTVTATDSDGGQTTVSLPTFVIAAATTWSSAGTPGGGTVNTAYSWTPTAPSTGGGITISNYAASGLPPGLSVNSTTGVVSGTPTSAGTYASVALSATDSAGNTVAAPDVSITIAAGMPETDLTVSSNGSSGYNVFTEAGSPAVATKVVVTINSGVVLGAPNTSTPALTVPSGFPAGSIVQIVNDGTIIGGGGGGGSGGTANDAALTSGTAGGGGGPAVSLAFATTIENNGTIGGGGGGGGGGQSYYCHNLPNGNPPPTYLFGADGGGGGGGGAGDGAGSGGGGGSGAANGAHSSGAAGAVGAQTTGGAAGTDGGNFAGGAGGGLGQAGAAGATVYAPGANSCAGQASSPGAGGAAGDAVSGSAYVTWSPEGTVDGPLN